MHNTYSGLGFLLLALVFAAYAVRSIFAGQLVFFGRRLRWHDPTVISIADQPVLFCVSVGFCVLFACCAAIFGRRLLLGLD